MGKLILIILSIFLIVSVAYAKIDSISFDDMKDHAKIASKLNEIISQVNYEMSKKADVEKVRVEMATKADNASFLSVSRSFDKLSKNLSVIHTTVGDPTGTISNTNTKLVKLMDILQTSSQHVVVRP
jgi:hypothetical protein